MRPPALERRNGFSLAGGAKTEIKK